MSQYGTLTQALQDLLDHYVSLVNSGDAGNWDPEEEPKVIAARAALSATQPAQAGWCPGCSPDNCQGCGPAAKTAQAAQGGPTCTEERPCVNCFAGTRPCLGPHKAAQGAGEVVYQYQNADGSWIDQQKSSYDYNVRYGAANVRVLYTQPAAGADVLDAVSPVGDWSYSHDEERFNGQFDTKEAAIAEGLSCGARFVGQVNHVRDIISDRQIGLDIYERIGEILGDEIGEAAECFTLSPDQQEVLGKVVLDWIESGPGFNCWGIKDSEPIDAAIAASGRQE